MSKVSNVLTMLQLLSTGKKYNIEELSEILEVTPRMVRVYKEELDKAGIYIDTIMGPYGGYVLNRSIRIPERKFKNNDYKLLDKYIDNAIGEEKEELTLLQDKIRGIYLGSINEKKELEPQINEKYNILTRAIKERRRVKIKYFSYNHGQTDRVIEPAEMFLFKDGWCCAAFCLLRGDLRHFELKRIINYELLDEKF